jgi:hypothetical protein
MLWSLSSYRRHPLATFSPALRIGQINLDQIRSKTVDIYAIYRYELEVTCREAANYWKGRLFSSRVRRLFHFDRRISGVSGL